jgi:DNA uptake protein ComE-like DNA-binding protein
MQDESIEKQCSTGRAEIQIDFKSCYTGASSAFATAIGQILQHYFIKGDEKLGSTLAPYKGYIAMMIAFAIVLAGTVYFLRRPEPAPITITTATPRATPTTGVVVIQLCGAVANPGLYTLPEGSRVQDALKRAGNALSNGDIGALNLARKLNDGEQICVPMASEITTNTSIASPLVTPKPSSACISYRDANAHMDQTTCVRGTVSSANKSGTTFYINFDEATDSFYAVSFNRTWDNLSGRCVEVNGRITVYRGRPEIILDNESQLGFCK